tara:strand:+ start:1322 stop:1453 length:132 start_codon:yes stop_codon:yes gene_type:complete
MLKMRTIESKQLILVGNALSHRARITINVFDVDQSESALAEAK